VWHRLADAIAALCLERFIDPETGALRERFGTDWAPLSGIEGQIVEPGHHCEWAFLLDRWGKLTGRARPAAVGKLIAFADRNGIDWRRGVAVNTIRLDGRVHDPIARLWPQTERVRAYIVDRKDGDDTRLYEAIATLWRYLDAPLSGLWSENLAADGRFAIEAARATSLYHIVGAVMELWSTFSRAHPPVCRRETEPRSGGRCMETVLVTGAAGFIGMHVARRLLAGGYAVLGADNLNSYYDPALKEARLGELRSFANFQFEKIDVADRKLVADLFSAYRFPLVVHLAAQVGVRYSLVDPHAYTDSNLIGFLNVLEGCRRAECRHLVYASSSSVYGANTSLPSRTLDNVDHPLNLYGATKKANELMAHAYAHLFAMPATGLRFFTVYGPWGRPDMAIWLFTAAIMQGSPVRLFNHGQMRRDFTFIDDITEAVVRLVTRPPAPNPAWSGDKPDPATSRAPWHVYNIGNSQPVELSEVVTQIEQAVGRAAVREFLPMQPGDVLETFADCSDLESAIGFRPSTALADGIQRFVQWYRDFHAGRNGQSE
jgi:UDP-glucuronate 4-epimerase